MLTARGWWLLLCVLALSAFGLLAGAEAGLHTLTVVALALVLWVGAEWAWFAVRVRLVLARLEVRRQLLDERGPVDALWAGRNFRVRVEVLLPDGVPGLPYAVLSDFSPFGVECGAGDTVYE